MPQSDYRDFTIWLLIKDTYSNYVLKERLPLADMLKPLYIMQ